MLQIGGGLPRTREMTECAVEGAGGTVLHAPGQGEAALGDAPAGDRQFDLVLGQAKQDAGIGPEVGEKIDLVPPLPTLAQVGRGRVIGVDMTDAMLEKAQPLPIAGQPEDIAQAALFLASDASRFVTGHCLVVDGGATAGQIAGAPRPGQERRQPQRSFAGPAFEN